jgi:hypothetical protein
MNQNSLQHDQNLSPQNKKQLYNSILNLKPIEFGNSTNHNEYLRKTLSEEKKNYTSIVLPSTENINLNLSGLIIYEFIKNLPYNSININELYELYYANAKVIYAEIYRRINTETSDFEHERKILESTKDRLIKSPILTHRIKEDICGIDKLLFEVNARINNVKDKDYYREYVPYDYSYYTSVDSPISDGNINSYKWIFEVIYDFIKSSLDNEKFHFIVRRTGKNFMFFYDRNSTKENPLFYVLEPTSIHFGSISLQRLIRFISIDMTYIGVITVLFPNLNSNPLEPRIYNRLKLPKIKNYEFETETIMKSKEIKCGEMFKYWCYNLTKKYRELSNNVEDLIVFNDIYDQTYNETLKQLDSVNNYNISIKPIRERINDQSQNLNEIKRSFDSDSNNSELFEIIHNIAADIEQLKKVEENYLNAKEDYILGLLPINFTEHYSQDFDTEWIKKIIDEVIYSKLHYFVFVKNGVCQLIISLDEVDRKNGDMFKMRNEEGFIVEKEELMKSEDLFFFFLVINMEGNKIGIITEIELYKYITYDETHYSTNDSISIYVPNSSEKVNGFHSITHRRHESKKYHDNMGRVGYNIYNGLYSQNNRNNVNVAQNNLGEYYGRSQDYINEYNRRYRNKDFGVDVIKKVQSYVGNNADNSSINKYNFNQNLNENNNLNSSAPQGKLQMQSFLGNDSKKDELYDFKIEKDSKPKDDRPKETESKLDSINEQVIKEHFDGTVKINNNLMEQYLNKKETKKKVIVTAQMIEDHFNDKIKLTDAQIESYYNNFEQERKSDLA